MQEVRTENKEQYLAIYNKVRMVSMTKAPSYIFFAMNGWPMKLGEDI